MKKDHIGLFSKQKTTASFQGIPVIISSIPVIILCDKDPCSKLLTNEIYV